MLFLVILAVAVAIDGDVAVAVAVAACSRCRYYFVEGVRQPKASLSLPALLPSFLLLKPWPHLVELSRFLLLVPSNPTYLRSHGPLDILLQSPLLGGWPGV